MDAVSKALDAEILRFLRKYASLHGPAPDREWDTLALRLFAFQFDRNRPYRKFCLAQGRNLSNVEHWKEIPAMPTVGFKELPLATFPVEKAAYVFRTSGTTEGRSGRHYLDTLRLYEASVAPSFERFCLPDGGAFTFYFLLASPKEAPHSSLSRMASIVRRHFGRGEGAFYVRGGRADFGALWRDLKRARRKAFLFTTVFSLKAFLDSLKTRRERLALPEGSRVLETGGFKGRMKTVPREALYRDCRQRLGIKLSHCLSEYGMTELSSQVYDSRLKDTIRRVRRRPVFAGPAWLRTLVVDPRTGREARSGAVGALRHYDLANRGSVIAVQTEDLGRRIGEGFELVGRAGGADLRGCSLAYERYLAASEEDAHYREEIAHHE